MPLAQQQLAGTESADLVFIDDNPAATNVNGHRVMGFKEFVRQPHSQKYVSIAIANGQVREDIAVRLQKAGVIPWDVRANTASIYDDVVVGAGSILCSHVTLTSNIRVGRFFQANIYSYVEHDCVIGDYVTFAPRVCCNGNIVIEDHAYIGAGAVIKQGKPGAPLVIGRGAVVGMGAVVTKSVAPGTTVVGNPATEMEA
jgi:sugar O-acyltransferase (sialic acid O-acetyltransferase NeuD family)